MKIKLKDILKVLWYINTKTIYFNLKYLRFKQAILFLIFISKNVYFKKTHGEIKIESNKIYSGMIRIGYGNIGIFDKKNLEQYGQ